ncbi:MAG: DUF3256 family protein [Bacteroidales bacterium]|nr:DUF3256 family protein [Bacteroidales bacterium]
MKFVLRFIFLFSLCVGSLTASGTKTIIAPDTLTAADVFVSLPAGVLEILTHETRRDLVDYARNDSTPALLNSLGGRSRILKLTPNFLEVKLTEASSMQIKVLTATGKKSPVIMTIYSVGNETTAGDSDVQFFDSSLKPLAVDKFLRQPEIRDFFQIPADADTSYKTLADMIPFPAYTFTASPDSDEVTARLTIGAAVSLDDKKILDRYLLPGVKYLWNGKRLQPVK